MYPFGSKIAIYEWFQQMQGWNRLDFICRLINLCNPFELRFVGSCIEDMAQSDYNCLRDQEIKANSVENLMQSLDKFSPDEFRSHLTVCLALLQSSNYKVATKLARILEDQLSMLDLEDLMLSGQEKVIEEWLLMLTLASYHPAFRSRERLCFKSKLMEYEMLNKRDRKNTRYGRLHRYSQQQQAAHKFNIGASSDRQIEVTQAVPSYHNYPVYPASVYGVVALSQDQFTYDIPLRNTAHSVPRTQQVSVGVFDNPQFVAMPNDLEYQESCSEARRSDGIATRTSDFGAEGDNVTADTFALSKGNRTDQGQFICDGSNPTDTSWKDLSNKPIYVSSTSVTQTSVFPTTTHFARQNVSGRTIVQGSWSNQSTFSNWPVTPTSAVSKTLYQHGSTESSSFCQSSGSQQTKSDKQHSSCHSTGDVQNFQGGDVQRKTSSEHLLNCFSKQNLKQGDNMSLLHDTTSSLKLLRVKTAIAGSEALHAPTQPKTEPGFISASPSTSSPVSMKANEGDDSLECAVTSESFQTFVPTDVSISLIPAEKTGDSVGMKEMAFKLKVKWNSGKLSECTKTVDEMLRFYEEVNEKLGTSICDSDFLTNQNNQILERGKILDKFFKDVLSTPLDILMQEGLLSFFKYPNNPPSFLSLPIKKRKLKGQRSTIRPDDNSSSSSTASPPLPNTSRNKILSPTARRPTSSLSPPSADNIVSTSLFLSSPAFPAKERILTSPAAQNEDVASDDGRTQNDPYFMLYYWLKPRRLLHLYTHLKRFTFEEFCNLEIEQVNSLQGLSVGEKSILNREIANLKDGQSGKTSSLEIDMGMLSIAANGAEETVEVNEVVTDMQERWNNGVDIKAIIDDANRTWSDDDNCNSAPVAFELPNDSAEDSLQAVKSKSCFSFEFDGSSATIDSPTRSTGLPSQKSSEVELDTTTADNGVNLAEMGFIEMPICPGGIEKTLSQPDISELPLVSQYPNTMSKSAPPMRQMTYFPKHLHLDEIVLGHPLVIQGQPPAYPCYQHMPAPHLQTLSMHPSDPSNTATSPTYVCASVYPAAPLTTLASNMLPRPSQKPLLLTYTPTTTSCVVQDGETTIYTATSPVYPIYSATSPVGGMPQNEIDSTSAMPQTSGYYHINELPHHHGTTVMPPSQLIYATNYNKPVTPISGVHPVNSDNIVVHQTAYNDSETDDHVSPHSSDPDISPRLTDAPVPARNAGAMASVGRFYARNNSSNRPSYVPQNQVQNFTQNAMYRLPGQQDNLHWPAMQRTPLGSSYSDPTHYTPSKNNPVRNDYAGNSFVHPGSNAGPHMYYMHNGYPESRQMYSLGPDQVARMQVTQHQSLPSVYSKRDALPPKKMEPASCYNCGKKGHIATDCLEPLAAEVLSSGYYLKMSQPVNSRRGND